MELLDGPAARERIAALVEKADNARIAVAFWGDGAVDGLGLARLGADARVVCNLRAGGTNPREIRRLLDAGASVVQHDSLHGKVYLFPECVLVGSSNASANGLSLQGHESDYWEEANVHATDAVFLGQMSSWFERVFAAGRPITEADLDAALDAWTRRRRHIATKGSAAATLLDALRANPLIYADRRFYLVVYTSDMDADGKKALYKARKQSDAGKELSGYQDWDGLPDDADLASFYFGPRGGCFFDGYWHMPAKREEVAAGRKSRVQLCRRIKAGAYPQPGPIEAWKEIITGLTKTEDWDDGAIVEMGELARRFLKILPP